MKRFNPMIESRVRETRAKLRISQYELAKLAGISQGTLSIVELGYRKASPKVRAALSTTLGIPENELFPEQV